MNNQYYRDSSIYRSRSPPRRRSSPPMLPRQHYSPPLRPARPRTPPRQVSPITDRRASDYSRYPERARPTRSLPWASQASSHPPPPPRQDYRTQERYRDLSPRAANRRQYEYTSTQEEVFYTQPQYSSYSSSRPSPATIPDQRSSQIVDVDPWSSGSYRRQPSPYYPQPPSRDYDDRRGSITRGSRDSPIYIDDFEPQSRDYSRNSGRWKNARESGAEKLIHEEWRPPPPVRPRTPPGPRMTWDNRTQRRPTVDNRERPNVSPPLNRNSRPPESQGFGENWVHPDRRGLIEEVRESENYTTPLPPPKVPLRDRASGSFPTPTPAPVPAPALVSPELPRPSFDSYQKDILRADSEPRTVKESRWDKRPTDLPERPLNIDEDESLRAKRLKNKKLKQQIPKHQRKSPITQVSRPSTQGSESSKSLTALTNGEKDQFINQMAKHAAELIFAQKGPGTSPNLPQAVRRPFVTPPGLNMLDMTATTKGSSHASVPPVSAEQWKRQLATLSSQTSNTGISSSSKGLSKEDAAATVPIGEAPQNMPFARTPGIGVTPNTPGTTPQKPSDKASSDIFHLPKPENTTRRRGNSIASSSSSNKSASPFLSAPLTPGFCTVCSEPDIPPLNRLAQCSECSKLYHQSCHTPALTKAILEEAAEKWTCKACKENTDEVTTEIHTSITSRFPLGARRTSGLSVTYKRYDAEKTLEESVKMNKSSLTALLQRHAEWKSPTFKGSQLGSGRTPESGVRQRSVNGPTLTIPVSNEMAQERTPEAVPTEKASLEAAIVSDLVVVQSSPSSTEACKDPARSTSVPSRKNETVQPSAVPAEPVNNRQPDSHSPHPNLIEAEIARQVSPAAPAAPAVKPPKRVIPASQPSDASQQSPPASNMALIEPELSPTVRPLNRSRSKRELVISDSEEETSQKRPKTVVPPRAAMKTAPSSRVPPLTNVAIKRALPGLPSKSIASMTVRKSAPSVKLKIASISTSTREDLKNLSETAKKSSVIAKKSGSKARPETPVSEQNESSVKPQDISITTTNLRDKGRDLATPISPVQSHGILRFPRPPSPLPATRPIDPGESQRYSLKLILTTGSNKNEPLVLDNEPAGFNFSTPYPIPLSSTVKPSVPATPRRKISRDKKNFDILSLVPKEAVPILEDGKLAFREGIIDPRTGHLKRGARKFRVGRIVPGETL